jgi:hypothetical protein
MYCFTDPECGSDVSKIVHNAKRRFHWIWLHDLKDSVEKAENEFRGLTSSIGDSNDTRLGAWYTFQHAPSSTASLIKSPDPDCEMDCRQSEQARERADEFHQRCYR